MKDWRAAVRTWDKTQNNNNNGNKQTPSEVGKFELIPIKYEY